MDKPNPYIGSYVEAGYTPESVHVADEVYSQILDAVVLACVDIVVVSAGRVLLGKRAWLPQADWWIIGGRMRPGEEIEAAAARHARRDLGLSISSERFRYLTTFSTGWRLRRHKPAHRGTHTVSIVMTVEVSLEESKAIVLNEEYVAQQWLARSAILDNADFHPALHQCVQALSSAHIDV